MMAGKDAFESFELGQESSAQVELGHIPVALPPPPTYDEFFSSSKRPPSVPFLRDTTGFSDKLESSTTNGRGNTKDNGGESGRRKEYDQMGGVDEDFRKMRQVLKERERGETTILSPNQGQRGAGYTSSSEHNQYLALFSVVETGSTEKVRREVQRLVTLEGRGFLLRSTFRNPQNKATALHHAILCGKTGAAQVLMQFGGPALVQEEMDTFVDKTLTFVAPLHMTIKREMTQLTQHIVVNVLQSEPLKQAAFSQMTTFLYKNQLICDITPLHIAALKGCTTTAALLIAHRADISCLSRNKDTPLQLAVRAGHLSMVELLQSHGANVNHQNGNMSTPLYEAVRFGHSQIVAYLIKQGAVVDKARDTGFQYPVICAAGLGHGTCFDILVANHADPKVITKQGSTAFHFAAAAGNVKILDKLLACGLDLEVQDSKGETPIFYAARNGNQETLLKLLMFGAKLDHKSKSGETVWNAAINCSHLTSLQELIRHVKATNPSGFTFQDSRIQFPPAIHPLHIATEAEDVSKLSVLLKSGVDQTTLDLSGNTYLHAAAKGDKIEILEMFGNRSNLNAENKDGDTCLHVACRSGSVRSTEFLAPRCALGHKNKEGQTALHAAATGSDGSNYLLRLLIDEIKKGDVTDVLGFRDNDGNSALHIAAQFQTGETIMCLKGLSFKTKNNDGNTPMHVALETSNMSSFSAMVALAKQSTSGFNLQIENNVKETALRVACRLRNLTAIERLIDCGASLAHRNSQNDTILHYLVSSHTLKTDHPHFKVIYGILHEISALWLCKFLKIEYPSGNAKLLKGYREIAMAILVHNIGNSLSLSVLKFAATTGVAPVLEVLLNTPGVAKTSTEHVFDVSNFIFHSMTRQDFDITSKAKEHKMADAKIKLLTGLTKNVGNNKPLLMQALHNNFDDVQAAKLLELTPFKQAVDYYYGGVQVSAFVFFIVHLIFMVFFSERVIESLKNIPTNTNGSGFNMTNETIIYRNLPSLTPVSKAFLVWPIGYLLDLLTFFFAGWIFLTKSKEKEFPDHMLVVQPYSSLRCLFWWWSILADNLLIIEVLDLCFVISSIAWIANQGTSHNRKEELSAFIIMTGWFLTFGYMRCFRNTFRFFHIIMDITFKTVTRYSFVLIPFFMACSYGVRALISNTPELLVTFQNTSDVFFEVYQWMANGESSIIDHMGVHSYTNAYLQILLLLFYLLQASALFGLLIAIVNQSYWELKKQPDETWKVRVLRYQMRYDFMPHIHFTRHIITRQTSRLAAGTRKLELRNSRFYLTISPDDTHDQRRDHVTELQAEAVRLKSAVGRLEQMTHR